MGCFSRSEVEIPDAKSQATFIGTILGQIYMKNPTGCTPMGFLCDSYSGRNCLYNLLYLNNKGRERKL